MNKNIILSIVGVVVVLGAIGLYMQGGVVGNMTGQETSLKELLASQNPQKCTFDHKADISDSSGEVYVANGKMRGNFNSVAAGKVVKSSMIVMNNTAYVWTDEMAQGFKMSLDAMTSASAEQNQSVDINQKLNYSCGGWSEDASVFALPSDITFSDMSALLNQAMPKGTTKGTISGTVEPGSLQSQCGMCDTITDPSSKSQCRTALQCK
ncbi:MAG: hypothetical protein AAB903_03375 [Patescibacteria group bacterium]